MSERKELFDNEMDEKTVESISDNFPILTDEEKDRIFSLIEREFDTPDIKHEDYKDEVSGVERCIRPRWREMLGTAAMIAIVVGSLGGGSYFMNNMKKKSPEDVKQEVTTEAVTESPAEQIVVNDTKPTVTTAQKKTEKNNAVSVVTIAMPVNDKNKTSVTAASEAVTAFDVKTDANDTTSLTESISDVTTMASEPVINVTETIAASATNKDNTQIVTTEVTAVNDRETELALVAEDLIEKYDTISMIKSAQLPREYEDDNVLTIMHDPVSPSTTSYTMHYRKINKSVFKNMDELKEFYYSVMYKNMFDKGVFGPELKYADLEHGYVFDSDTPDYFYISVDGELYGNIFGSKELLERTDDPVTLSEIGEYRFQAQKKYHKEDNKICTATFGIIKNLESGKWVIFNISYD